MATKKVSLPVISIDDAELDPDAQDRRFKGKLCQGCAFEGESHPRLPGAGANSPVDIMMVSESPSSWSAQNQKIFNGRGGRIIRQTWETLKQQDRDHGNRQQLNRLKLYSTYAIQCQVEQGRDQTIKIPATALERCAHYLHAAIKNRRPKVILVFGSNALKALGYRAKNFMESRGRLLEMDIQGHPVKVIATFSTRHVVAKTGLYNLFLNDFTRAVKLASGVDEERSQISIEELTKNYQLPQTVEEVETLCEEIVNYTGTPETPSQNWTIAVDTETNTKFPHRKDAKVLCISFAWGTGLATAIPLWHASAPWGEGNERVLAAVRRVLECAKPKTFHNAKFDLKMLENRHGLKVINVAWDTMLGEHLLREDMSGAYSLKILGRSFFPEFANYADHVQELAEKLTEDEDAIQQALANVKKSRAVTRKAAVVTEAVEESPKKKKKKKAAPVPVVEETPGFEDGLVFTMDKADVEQYLFGKKRDRNKTADDSGYERVPLDILLVYAAIDTDLTRRLIRHQFQRLHDERYADKAKNLMSTLCIPASRALGDMEFGGMRVDRPYLETLEEKLTAIVAERQLEMRQYWVPSDRFPGEFNPNATDHVSRVLFDGYNLNGTFVTREGPWVERNVKSNKWKTDKHTLKAIVERTQCPFATALLQYRAAHKAISGFVHDIRILSEYDGRLHTNFHLHGTATGRLSSSDLNMQNIGHWLARQNIKKIFIPDDPETELLVNVDYKGAELRVFTAYARDGKLIDALNNGLDIHSLFVQEIYNIAYDVVAAHESLQYTDPDQYMYLKKLRTGCKRVVFGILYGAMARKIAKEIGDTEEAAQKIIDMMFEKFPSLKAYMDETVEQIHKYGFVETLLGRRRRFPLQHINGFFRGQAERQGKNMKVQSTSSDIVLGQVIELHQHIQELGGRLCITVHDSIVATIKKKYAGQLPDFMQKYCVDRVAEKYPWLPVVFSVDVQVGSNYGETELIDTYLKTHQIVRQPSETEMTDIDFDQEALDALREDEADAVAKEEVAVSA